MPDRPPVLPCPWLFSRTRATFTSIANWVGNQRWGDLVMRYRVPLVMSQVAKLLNVEGYPMVSSDPATQAVTLDAELLAEQYGVQVRLC